jgi:hypothetical protein
MCINSFTHTHTQNFVLSVYSRLRVPAVNASNHQAVYSVDTGKITYCGKMGICPFTNKGENCILLQYIIFPLLA